MDINSPRIQDNPSPTTSPHRNGGGGSCSTSNGSSVMLVATPPLTPNPNPIFRSNESNPYPTTFVQADTSSFKQVVQMLTGSTETAKQASRTDSTSAAAAPRGGGGSSSSSSIPPIRSTGQKKQGFKLYERRNSLKNGLMINTLMSGFSQNSVFSPRKPEILSPSILDFPALVLSPATPLNKDNLSRSSPAAVGNSLEEEKAIAEKKFYFHPSPRTAPGNAEPQLLPLFPVTSPRVSGSSS